MTTVTAELGRKPAAPRKSQSKPKIHKRRPTLLKVQRRHHHPRSLLDVAERLAGIGVTYAMLRGATKRGEIATEKLSGIARIPFREEQRLIELLSVETETK
jgi:hypothetical protein